MARIPHSFTGLRRVPAGARGVAAVAALAAAAALSAAAADADFVTVLGGRLRCGERPVAFVCAAGARLPAPDPAAGTNALAEACAAARGIARDLALAGFGMVRLTDLAVPRPGDPATEARLAVQDEFVAACKDEGLRIWAEVLHPVLDFVPSPADADALDDPATREAWREAVAGTNLPAASILLAAPWDPRLEVLVQRRLRDWARAFNPRTGLRRCDDPAYALFSFSSLWWEDMDAAEPPDLPPFLERELLDAWNDWLYERHGTDQALRDRFGLAPGETLASNSVAFPPPELAPGSARAREQRTFLHGLSVSHLSRLLAPFSSFGQASRTAPRLVRHGGHAPTIPPLSTIGFLEPRSYAERQGAPSGDAPFVLDAVALAGTDGNPLRAAWSAVDASADILVLPAGDDPFRWSPAAAVFLAARDDRDALPGHTRRSDGAFDFPTAAHARLVVPAPGAEPSVATFPAAGAAVAVVRVPAGEQPAFPPELAASDLPRQFLVCFPPEEEAPRAVLDATVLRPASRPGACILVLRSRDGSGIGAFSVLARGRDLAKRECLPGGRPPAVPAEEGVFRADGLASPAVLLFRPSAPGPGLLRGL
jgi:hypothetical protein